MFIVTQPVAERHPERTDLIFPIEPLESGGRDMLVFKQLAEFVPPVNRQ
jgi:hypothetical protein